MEANQQGAQRGLRHTLLRERLSASWLTEAPWFLHTVFAATRRKATMYNSSQSVAF